MGKAKICGVTIVKDGVKLDYPFVEAIQSGMPLVDEFIVVVGESEDGTLEKVQEINSPKIKILSTTWDPKLREGGKILAQQTDVGLANASGDWVLYLQADEVLHENDLKGIRQAANRFADDYSVDGFLFDYHHFWGYHHTVKSRRAYRREIRMVRLTPEVFSYRDAQGFRKKSEKTKDGEKLSVIHLKGPHIYAYSRVREPQQELEKVKQIAQYWHTDEFIETKYENVDAWDYDNIDSLQEFDQANHPSVMLARAKTSSRLRLSGKSKYRSFKDRVAQSIERLTGIRIGEYRNYKIVGNHTV